MKLGFILVHSNVITREQLENALGEQLAQTNGQKPLLGDLLIELGYCTGEQIERAIDEQHTCSLDLTAAEADVRRAMSRFEDRWEEFKVLQNEALRPRTDEISVEEINAAKQELGL